MNKKRNFAELFNLDYDEDFNQYYVDGSRAVITSGDYLINGVYVQFKWDGDYKEID